MGVSQAREEKSDNGQKPLPGKTKGGCVFNSESEMAVAVPCVYWIGIADKFYKHLQHAYNSFLRHQYQHLVWRGHVVICHSQ